ncbi:CHASE4 domain-containing protein [Chloroflexota bacterium]
MSLRTKALLITIIGLAVMVGTLYVTSRVTLMRGLAEIEKQDAQKYIDRTLSVLSQEISDLERTTADWSSWDDTYNFIEDANDEYIESNLVDEAFITLRLNLMLYIHSSGRIVFSKAFDLENEEPVPITSSFFADFSTNDLIGTESVISGIILIKEGSMIIASQPILTSNDEGPARGTLVFGRYIKDTAIDRLALLTLSELTLHRIDELPPDLDAVLPSVREASQAFVQLLSTQQVAAYSMITDIYGKPALMLRIIIPREIYSAGQDAVIFHILVVLGIGLIFGGIIMWIIHKQLLVRTDLLVRGVNNIASSGDTTTRLDIGGRDELTLVAGTINGMLAVLQEVENELQNLYHEERDLRKGLEQEISNRAEYTRALVHELKTPITPVLAASELMLEELQESPMRDLAMSINRSASNLNRRIDELLNLARGEIGQLKLNGAQVDAKKLLLEIADEIQSITAQEGQILTRELPDDLPYIWADEERLKQIVQNLINNAIKFTPKGGTITLRARRDDTNLIVEVGDSGKGISEEEQEQIFDPYHRQESDSERLSGLGLGLAIAKKFVELHEGQIWVKSKKGKGSTFTFSIPMKAPG